jgi:hypothetical protein
LYFPGQVFKLITFLCPPQWKWVSNNLAYSFLTFPEFCSTNISLPVYNTFKFLSIAFIFLLFLSFYTSNICSTELAVRYVFVDALQTMAKQSHRFISTKFDKQDMGMVKYYMLMWYSKTDVFFNSAHQNFQLRPQRICL